MGQRPTLPQLPENPPRTARTKALAPVFPSLPRPGPTSPSLQLPFAWSSGKPLTSGCAAVGGAKMAEERHPSVSADCLVWGWLQDGTGQGCIQRSSAQQGGEAGWRAACVPRSCPWRSVQPGQRRGVGGRRGPAPGNCGAWSKAEFFASRLLC